MPVVDSVKRTDRSNAWHNEQNRLSRDIGIGYPELGDLQRRKSCERNFRLFCEAYFKNAFTLAWSPDHLAAIARMETMVLDGGLFALAMPRASGKTTISVRAAIWALLYGHRRFICLVGATETLAETLLKQFKTELTFNESLARDFRQVCYPFKRLENNARKAIGQLFQGEQTRIEWQADRLTFPTMPDSACDGMNVSGSTVTVAGLTGAIRGQSHTLSSGEILRPELVILDDPQTRESAMSVLQSGSRADIINGDVLGMAGPDRKIAAIMPCTVIREGDMADKILDRRKNPEWNGQRTKMVYSFPTNEKLWDEYATVRDESFRADRGGADATEFYKANREAMDAGAHIAWPERFNHDELSAIQHAMNLKLRNEAAFFAEYQNEPLPILPIDESLLTADDIASKVNRMKRGAIPITASRLTAFIDVQSKALFYAVAAWEDDFTGYVIDYGTWPDQKRAYFALRDVKNTMAAATKAAGQEGQIYAGLEALTQLLLGREWLRDDGAGLHIERCLIDQGWGESTDVVQQFCRQSAFPTVVTPSKGVGIGASSRPFNEYTNKPGDRVGLNWRMPLVQGKRAIRHVAVDTNFWKSFVFTRLAVQMGDRGCLSLFGDKPEQHRLFAEHLTAEYRVKTQKVGSTRTVDEWKEKPNHPDNHWFDCLVGCAVAASMQGVALRESSDANPVKRERLTFAQLRERHKTTGA